MNDTFTLQISSPFEKQFHPVRLEVADAQRLFEDLHAPQTRKVLEVLGFRLHHATLLDRHVIGTCYNFVRDQDIHRHYEGAGVVEFFSQHFKLCTNVHTLLAEAGKLARGLEREWIAEAACEIGLGVALAITDGRPLLAPEIRRLLFTLAQDSDWGPLRQARTMREVCQMLRAHLSSWRAPEALDGAVMLGWIRATLPDRAHRSKRERRHLPREVKGPGAAGLAGVVAALQQEVARLCAEVARLRGGSGGSAARGGFAGSARANAADRAADPADPADPGVSDTGSGTSNASGGVSDAGPAVNHAAGSAGSAGSDGSARANAADRAADPADPADRGAGSAGSDGSDESAQGAYQRPPRVRCPYLLSEHDDAIPVHDPGFPLAPFELLTCEIIVTAAELTRQVKLLMNGRRQPGGAIAHLLQLRTGRAAARFHSHCEALRPLIETAAAEGLAFLQSQAGPDGAVQLPVHTDFLAHRPADLYPIAWVVVLERDPLDDPQPLRLEPVVWRLLGVLDALHQRLEPWLQQRRDGAVAECMLLYQLDQGLRRAYDLLYRVRAEFMQGAAQGLLVEQEHGCTEALLEVSQQMPLDLTEVTIGSDVPVPAVARLGLDQQGRHMALSLFVSQLVLALGGRNWGKSHLGRLIAECLHLHLPGANRLPFPLRSATFEVDYHLGPGRRQMLRGFFPNTDAQQMAQLHAYYGSKVNNAAFLQGILRCLPEGLKPLRAELPAYIERGLVVEPLELGPQNLGQIGWEAILGGAFTRGSDRPLYADHLAALIGSYGDQMMPDVLIGELEDGKEFARVRGGLINQTLPLRGLVRRGADVRDDYRQGCPVFYLLECQHSAESFLLGLLVAVMHALAQPTGRPQDEVMLWMFCDELSKLMDLPVVGRLLLAMAKELRHRKVSLFLGGQTASNLPADLLGLVSVLFLFHLSSAAGFRPLQELEYFREVSYDEQVRLLMRGQALVGAVHSTDPLLRQVAQWLWLRPTFIDAGGESLTL